MNKFNFENIVNNLILEFVDETKKIQRVDMSKINPRQVQEIPDWSRIKGDDERIKKELGIKASVDTIGDLYGDLKGIDKAAVDKIQDDLSNNMKKRSGMDSIDVGEDGINPYGKKKKFGTGVKTFLKNKNIDKIDMGVSGKSFLYGNKKIPPSTMIINLTDAINCPSKCDLRGICYAGQNNTQYPSAQLRNIRNKIAFETLTIQDVVKWIEAFIEHAPVRITQIRISEDGDFEYQHDVKIADDLAGHFEKKYGIVTTCYTHRKDLDFTKCKHMIVNMSVLDTTQGDRKYLVCSEAMYDKLEFGGIKELTNDNVTISDEEYIESYKGIKNKVKKKNDIDSSKKLDRKFRKIIGEKYFKCCCDCMRCNFCYQRKEENGEDPNSMTNVICHVH